MKLYKRPLKGLADLKREKVLLRYMRDEHTTDDLFSTESLRRGGKKKKNNLGEEASPASDLLSVAMGILGGKASGSALTGSLPLLRMASKFLPKKKIAGFALEIASGYLKWRAIETGIWLIKRTLKEKKERKRLSREASLHHPVHQFGGKKSGKKAKGMLQSLFS